MLVCLPWCHSKPKACDFQQKLIIYYGIVFLIIIIPTYFLYTFRNCHLDSYNSTEGLVPVVCQILVLCMLCSFSQLHCWCWHWHWIGLPYMLKPCAASSNNNTKIDLRDDHYPSLLLLFHFYFKLDNAIFKLFL